MVDVADFIFSICKNFFDSFLSDWGIIGFGIISIFIIPRVANFVKRLFL